MKKFNCFRNKRIGLAIIFCSFLLTGCNILDFLHSSTSETQNESKNENKNKLELLSFGLEGRSNSKILLREPEDSPPENTQTNQDIYIDTSEDVILVAEVKNEDRLSFVDIVVYSQAMDTLCVFNEGNGLYQCSTTTISKDNLWVTDIRLRINYSLINLSEDYCLDTKLVEIKEISFLNAGGGMEKPDLSNCDVKTVNFYYNNETNMKGHDWGEWEILVPPTCDEPGIAKRVCNHDSSHVQEGQISKNGHNYDSEQICTVCGHSYPSEYLAFELDNVNDAYLVTGFSSNEFRNNIKNVRIPQTYNDKPVIGVGRSAFEYAQIESIVFPNTVVFVDDYAFRFSCISELTLPDSLTSIGFEAFSYCSNLLKINTGNGLTIAKSFYANSQLQTVVLGLNIIEIEEDAFVGCDHLVEVINLSSIQLTRGDWHNGYIAYRALTIHTSLTSKIYQDGDFEYIESDDDELFAIKYCGDEKEIMDFPLLNINYHIGDYLFYENEYIKKVIVPETVISIGEFSFARCNLLSEVFISDSVRSIKNNAFGDSPVLKKVTLPKELDYVGNSIFLACMELNELIMANKMPIVSENMFSFTKITSIVLPDNVTEIDRWAFRDCTKLKTLELYNNVVLIEKAAFEGCSSLNSIIFHGTQSEWNSISIDNDQGGNDRLNNASVSFVS